MAEQIQEDLKDTTPRIDEATKKKLREYQTNKDQTLDWNEEERARFKQQLETNADLRKIARIVENEIRTEIFAERLQQAGEDFEGTEGESNTARQTLENAYRENAEGLDPEHRKGLEELILDLVRRALLDEETPEKLFKGLEDSERHGWLDQMVTLAEAKKIADFIAKKAAEYKAQEAQAAAIESERQALPFPDENPHPLWSEQSEFFQNRPNGELTLEDLANGYGEITLAPGVEVRCDVGLTFYHVVAGDNPTVIQNKLAPFAKNPGKYDKLELAGIKNGFNIDPRNIQIGLWLPISLEQERRELSDEQFLNYAYKALRQVKTNPNHPYYKEIFKIIEKVPEQQILAALLAIAKQESGGQPLGKEGYHRWEEPSRTRQRWSYSLSIFHILMEGPGEKSRQKLGMTQGQICHPQNSVQLLLGYFIEKSKRVKINGCKEPSDYFPIDQHLAEFATFYNGVNWQTTNHNYDLQLEYYYKRAQALLKNETPKMESMFLRVGKRSRFIYEAILDANVFNSDLLRTTNPMANNILISNQDVRKIANQVESYLKDKYKSKKYFPTDRITVWEDGAGPYVIFERNENFFGKGERSPKIRIETGTGVPIKTSLKERTRHQETAAR